jgi:thioredoxin reductase (NADPH)
MKLLQSDIVIIGAGPVGLFTVFQAGMLGLSSTVIDALDFIGGQCSALYPEKPIYDIPAFKMINGIDLIKNLEDQASPFEPIYLLGRTAEKLYKHEDSWRIETSAGDVIESKAVIIACGVGAFTHNRPPIENIDKFEGYSILYSVKDVENFRNKNVVIAGGGDSALDWAISISEIASSVSVVHRRDKFKALPSTVSTLKKLVEIGKINLFTHYQLQGIKGCATSIEQVTIENMEGEIKELKADFLLPFFGMKTELRSILDWGLEIEKNHIKVNPSTMETNLEKVFAIGDVSDYLGKLKFILTGFSESALASHSAYHAINPSKVLHFEYSTTKGVSKLEK